MSGSGTKEGWGKVIKLGSVIIDTDTMAVYRANKPVGITPQEYKLLLYIAERPGRIIPREELLREVWGCAYPIDSRMVAVTLYRLRRKIEDDPKNPKIILSRRGFGVICYLTR